MSGYGRPVAGRLNGIHAEAGTIMGRRALTLEPLVVIDNDEAGMVLGYATPAELSAALLVALESPRSRFEHIMARSAR